MELKKITQVELDEILKQHQKWLNSGGNKEHQADLSYIDLSGMDLSDMDLSFADLHSANLQGADLSSANLPGVNLRGANLRDADLWYAELENADLRGANLHSANLQGVHLWHTNLENTNLQGADLKGADLQQADLRCANLRWVNLQGANLQDVKLSWVNWHEAKNIKVYVAGLQSSRENAQLTYIPSIDVATTGCWQGTWQATIKRIHSVYAEDTRERKAYDLAIEYIQAQMDLDNVEA